MAPTASEQSTTRDKPAAPTSRTGSSNQTHVSDTVIELPESIQNVLSQNEVSAATLRTFFEELIRYSDQRYNAYLDEALDPLVEHCLSDVRMTIDKRIDEITGSIEDIRTTTTSLDQRLTDIEQRLGRLTERERAQEREPQTPPNKTFIRPFQLPPTPGTERLRQPIQRTFEEPIDQERLNPALFQSKPTDNSNRQTELATGIPATSLWHFGPIEHGVEPLTTLLPEFRRVIDYRSYRLQDTSPLDNQATVYKGSASKIVTRMRSLMPRLANFDGRNPIALLRFLRDIQQAFDGVRLSEGAAVRTVSWFLEGDALQTYSSRAFSGIRRTIDTNVTWSYVVNTLLERYLSDDILSDAFTKVTTAVQNVDDNEDENAFLTRIERYADDCCGVFDDYLLVNYFLRGLSHAIRPIVSQRVHELTTVRRSNLNVVRRLAQAEGDAYRAHLSHTAYRPSPNRLTSKRSNATSESTLLIEPRKPFQSLHGEPPTVVAPVMTEVTFPVSPSLSSNETADATIDATIQKRIEAFLPTRVPTLSQEQTAMAQSMIPKDSDAHVCWLCRLDGHTLYMCPYLTESQRIYSAYQNYRYQLETRPHMRNLLEQRAQEHVEALSGKSNETKPSRPKPPYNRGPSRGSSRRTILQRGDSVQRQTNFPKNVLDAVMTIQQHANATSVPSINELLAQCAPTEKPPNEHTNHEHRVTFDPSVDTDERKPSPATSDSDSSKNE